MPLDENDARYYLGKAEDLMGRRKKAIGCGCFLLILIVVLLVVLAFVAPLFMGGGEVDYDDMGRPGIERTF